MGGELLRSILRKIRLAWAGCIPLESTPCFSRPSYHLSLLSILFRSLCQCLVGRKIALVLSGAFFGCIGLQSQVPQFLGDLDSDSVTTIKDLVILSNHLSNAAPLPAGVALFGDLDQNGVLDADDLSMMLDVVMGRTPPPRTPFAFITESSPQNGESGVALTRETIVRFSLPLSESSVIDASVIEARFGEESILGQSHLSADRQTISLFYPQGLPPSARVRVTVNGDRLLDTRGFLIDADGDGVPGGVRTIDFDTLTVSSVSSTAVCGRIFASDLEPNVNGSTFVNRPLSGVTISVDGSNLSVVSDENGNFRLENAPAGRFFVHIDGRTVPNVMPLGAYYPIVGKAWESIAGQEVNIGEIYLPIIPPETLKETSSSEATVLEFTPDFITQNPKFEGVQVVVPPNSLFNDQGDRGGMVGIAPVQPDRLPGAVNSDLPIQDVVTIQTDGATNFDVPAPICLPNLEDPLTGRKLSPGEKAALWSFNHDLGRFEIVGSMTVNDDGTLICTDPSVGVLAPGWHGSSTGTQGDGGSLRTVRRKRDKQEKPGKEDPAGDPENQIRIPCPDNPNRYIVLYKNRKRPARNPEAAGGDPVYLHSGEFYEPVTDLRIVGREIDFIWSRKYRSVTGRATAQGNGWDFSYNIFIRPEGGDFVVCDGNAREDLYQKQDKGVWTAAGFFRTLEENFDGSYTLRFDHQGVWIFHPFDGRPEGGRIATIRERNGNQLRFAYDEQGRLSEITDSLDRPIQVRYNGQSLISEVVDFSGRVIRYEYFGNNEDGGNLGDLKSVTSPAVTNTPTENDFPNGKTTSYTYSTGFEDSRLNGNLQTITDGRRNDPSDPTFGAGPYLRNHYSATTDPDDPNFDRIVRQVWGNPDEVIDYHYSPLLPSNANRRAVVRTIINDRRGLVKEYFYDEANRLVVFREYTGFADRSRPTTATTNRPEGKTRSSDPEFFETVFEWNEQHLLTRTILPNGNIQERVYEGDLNPNADQKTAANLVATRLLPGTHTPGGDQSVIEERYEYDSDFNGCCGFNFVTKFTDGRGNVTTHDYDDRGNRVRTVHRISSVVESYEFNEFGQLRARVYPDNNGVSRRDEMVYYTEGPQRGYLHRVIRDADNFAYETEMDYDRVGNIVSVTDPTGHTKSFVVNELNQVVREISREVISGSGVRYQQDYLFDANNNVIRVDAPNVDHLGNVSANAVFTTHYEYEILNHPITKRQEIDASREKVTEYRYDENRNRILMRFGEAVNGNQPNNNLAWTYDSRDLVFQMIRAQGDAAQSTSEFDYDANENIIAERHGIENKAPHITRRVFDSYDRPVEVIDPMGNRTLFLYDANHNLVRQVKLGELEDRIGSQGDVKLFAENAIYDALNRLVRIDTELFDVDSGESIDDGLSTLAYRYNNTSLLTQITDDNGNVSRRSYDSMYRPLTFEDALGNSATYTYDGRSNITQIVEVDQSDSGGESETFVQQFEVDNLDRVVKHIDNLGNTSEFGHNSRNDLTFQSDAVRAEANGGGNVIRHEYDGVRRWIGTIRELTASGMGGGESVNTITVRNRYDDSDRIISRIDDNGNETAYSYDSLDRMTSVEYADGTSERKQYDAHSNPIQWLDANGTEIIAAYDRLNRIVRRDITPGAGVSRATTFEAFVYDGFSRLGVFQNDHSTVKRRFNSRGQIIQENLNGVVSSAVFDGMNNMLRCSYPNDLTTNMSYDRVNRLTRVDDALGLIANPSYLGRVRMESCEYGNGTLTVNRYDGDRRRTQVSHISPLQNLFDDRSFDWDAMDNKTSHRDRLSGQAATFSYDSAYRLLSSDSGLNGSKTYRYDGVGNRLSVEGGVHAGDYVMDADNDGATDRQVNQYSKTPLGDRQYDAKGNLIDSNDSVYSYDYRNQLVSFIDTVNGVLATYRYDAMGRRIERAITRNGNEEVTRYYYHGPRVIEEQNGEGLMQRQFVYGLYVDDVLNMRTDTENFFYHCDDNHNVRKITNRIGQVVESYDYDDFGAPLISVTDGEPSSVSGIGNPYLFNGRRFDPESGFYYYRSRYMDPQVGRFISRDYLGVWGDRGNHGNAYSFVGNNPHTFLDPSGMKPKDGERTPYERTTPTGTIGHFHDRPLDVGGGVVAAAGEWITRGVSVLGYVVPDVLEPNLVAAHEHYFTGAYDESTPAEGHYGYGAGTREYLSNYNWQVSGEYYDDVMGMARDMIDSEYYPGGMNNYGMFTNNCQHYTDSLRRWYDHFLNSLCDESGSGLGARSDRILRRMWTSRYGDVDIVITSD